VDNTVNEVKVIILGLLSCHRQTYELFKIYEKHISHPFNVNIIKFVKTM